MKLTFRKAQPEDFPFIFTLADKIWRVHYPSIISMAQIDYMLGSMYSSESMRKQMQEGQEYNLAYDGSELLGYISVSSKDRKNYFLHKLYVDAGKHRRGLGKELFRYVFSKLQGVERIELTVNRKNIKAINFYFKMGFYIDRCEDFDIGQGFFMNDFIMIKKA